MSKTAKYLGFFILLGAGTGLALGWAGLGQITRWFEGFTSPITYSPSQTSAGYADTVAKILPSVVRIYGIRIDQDANPKLLQDPHYQQFTVGQPITEQVAGISFGSGVIISQTGHILTNHHIIAHADRIEADLYDGRKAQATIIGIDPATDLALLQIDLPALQPALIPAQINSRPGDIVLAIGNPHGLGTSVSMGIISAMERNQLGLNTYENFIQVDAPINQGNSGGALINTAGQLIGINSAHYYNTSTSTRSQGLGLAIPISTAKQIVNSIIRDGKVIRGWLGVTSELISQQAAGALQQYGQDEKILITGVYIGSPAHKAGLQQGDIITQFDGQSADNARAALDYIADLKPGSKLSITYQRKGQEATTTATIGVRPPSQ
ncbi:MAG: trypsin-like peptidase domain-containing protein [Gammaproteobacteria bacterium]|jgi:S1-C subfamily serine protease|nr:trypsin-like peptidase domain-containing protein [Gammaproteobacteria bacterium]